MYSKFCKKLVRGFSLVELSVVIIIISLIISAITAGVRILGASEVKRFVLDVQNFQIAIENFQSRYDAFPGDMSEATKYWGTYSVSNPKGTADGNADGLIDYSISGENESLRAWQQLVLSGFLEGNYTGVSTNGNQADLRINVPSSKRDKVGYMLFSGPFAGNDRNNLIIGGFLASDSLKSGALKAKEALSIDKKLDDGFPSSGVILSESKPGSTGCVSNGGLNNSYDVKGSSKDLLTCRLSFPIVP